MDLDSLTNDQSRHLLSPEFEMSLPESGDPSTARLAEVSQNNRPNDVVKFDVGKIEVKPAAVGKISMSAAAGRIAAEQSSRGNLMIAMIALLFVGTANLALGGYGLVRSTQGINIASRRYAEANNPSAARRATVRRSGISIAAVVGAYLYERGAKPAQTSPKA
jgi:hypothetical protein